MLFDKNRNALDKNRNYNNKNRYAYNKNSYSLRNLCPNMIAPIKEVFELNDIQYKG